MGERSPTADTSAPRLSTDPPGLERNVRTHRSREFHQYSKIDKRRTWSPLFFASQNVRRFLSKTVQPHPGEQRSTRTPEFQADCRKLGSSPCYQSFRSHKQSPWVCITFQSHISSMRLNQFVLVGLLAALDLLAAEFLIC